MTARTTSQHMAPWNPRTSLTTTEYLFGSCGGQLWSFWKEQEWSNYEFHRAKLTCHNEEWKQIKLQSFEHVKVWKRFKMFEIFEVSPCRVIPLCSYPTHLNIFKGISRAFLRHWIWSSLSRVLWAPKAHTSLALHTMCVGIRSHCLYSVTKLLIWKQTCLQSCNVCLFPPSQYI